MSDSPTVPMNDPFVTSLLKYALLAPSSHNTQPWWFKVSGCRIALYADRTRALPVNDPGDRELTISCGCALMNLRLAAAEIGLEATSVLLPVAEDEDLLAEVEMVASDNPSLKETGLFACIERRRTYRKAFEVREVPAAVVKALSDEAAKEGAWLRVVDVDEKRQEVAVLVAEGDAIQWSDPSWRRELAAWMHPRRQGDGLTVPGLVAPVVQFAVRSFDMGNGLGAKDNKLADESPVLAVLGTEGDAVVDWLQAGQALQRVLLLACSQGLQASYLNQPIQVASLRPRLQHLIGRHGFPQILLRLGYPAEEVPAAPRRRVTEVIVD